MTEEGGMPEEPLRRAQVHLCEAFDAVIARSVLEYDLTPADVVGVLECVKHRFLIRMDEECEDMEGAGDGST